MIGHRMEEIEALFVERHRIWYDGERDCLVSNAALVLCAILKELNNRVIKLEGVS